MDTLYAAIFIGLVHHLAALLGPRITAGSEPSWGTRTLPSVKYGTTLGTICSAWNGGATLEHPANPGMVSLGPAAAHQRRLQVNFRAQMSGDVVAQC